MVIELPLDAQVRAHWRLLKKATIQLEASLVAPAESVCKRWNNAVLLFQDQVRSYQEGEPQHRATEAFTIIVTKATPNSAHPDLYCAFIAYYDGRYYRRAAYGDTLGSVIEALQSLLDTTALALAADLDMAIVMDFGANWVEHGGESVRNGDPSPTNSEAGCDD
ncbi:hypothetical protein LTR17_002685 [Elasticomyces elasticus]|nr:hypothetical protein LTR17_002685 [Elasticomyces elasticus]